MVSAEATSSWSGLRGIAARLEVQFACYVAIAVLLAAAGLTDLWGVYPRLETLASPWWSLATAIPASALILLKHRAPRFALGAAAVMFAIDLGTVSGIVPFILLLEFIHVRVSTLPLPQRRRALGIIVGAVVALTLLAFIHTGSLRVTILIGLQLGALFGFTYWYANSAAQADELVALYRERAENAELVAARRRADAVRGERVRMAEDLHDEVAGHVAAVAIRSEAALSASAAERPADDPAVTAEEYREALLAVRDASLNAHAALRSMIAVLRSADAEAVEPPSWERIPELIAEARAAGLRVLVDDHRGPSGGAAPFDPECREAAVRVVQEALANCARHASRGHVRVVLDPTPRGLAITVRSRGGVRVRMPVVPGTGAGLRFLEDRIERIGGEFSAAPDNDAWVVRAEVPHRSAS